MLWWCLLFKMGMEIKNMINYDELKSNLNNLQNRIDKIGESL